MNKFKFFELLSDIQKNLTNIHKKIEIRKNGYIIKKVVLNTSTQFNSFIENFQKNIYYNRYLDINQYIKDEIKFRYYSYTNKKNYHWGYLLNLNTGLYYGNNWTSSSNFSKETGFGQHEVLFKFNNNEIKHYINKGILIKKPINFLEKGFTEKSLINFTNKTWGDLGRNTLIFDLDTQSSNIYMYTDQGHVIDNFDIVKHNPMLTIGGLLVKNGMVSGDLSKYLLEKNDIVQNWSELDDDILLGKISEILKQMGHLKNDENITALYEDNFSTVIIDII